jgi:hypothetical protein
MKVTEALQHISYGYYVTIDKNSDNAKLIQIIGSHEKIHMYRSKVDAAGPSFPNKLYMEFTVIPEWNDDDHSGYLPDLNYIDEEICHAFELAGFRRA